MANNTSPAGFYFDADGKCHGPLDLHSSLPDGAIPTEDGGAWVFNTGPNEYELIHVDADGEKELLHSGTEFASYNFRNKGWPEVVGVLNDSLLAITLRQDPLVTVISMKTGKTSKIGEIPEYYRPITEKLKPGLTSTEDLFADFRRVATGKSKTLGLQKLSNNRLLVFFNNSYVTFESAKSNMGIEILHASGEVLNAEPILFRGYLSGVIGASHGFLFRNGQSYELGDEGIDQNAPIIVYKYVGR